MKNILGLLQLILQLSILCLQLNQATENKDKQNLPQQNINSYAQPMRKLLRFKSDKCGDKIFGMQGLYYRNIGCNYQQQVIQPIMECGIAKNGIKRLMILTAVINILMIPMEILHLDHHH